MCLSKLNDDDDDDDDNDLPLDQFQECLLVTLFTN